MRQLHQLSGGRVGVATHLAVETLEDLLAVSNGSVADHKDVLAACHQIGNEVFDGANGRFRHLLNSTWHLAVHRVEHFALASVDDRDDHAVGVAARERQQVERRDADHRHGQRLSDRLRSGQPDAHAGE